MKKPLAALFSMLFALAAVPSFAQAQDWPARPVKFVVAFAPGGANDIVTRLLAQGLTDRLKTQFIVENRPGAAGRIAATYVAREKPDGYTFFMGAPGLLVLNNLLFKDMDTKPADFAGVSLVGILPYVLVTNNKLNVGSVAELVAAAKARPGALNHGSTGSGPTLVQQLFKDRTGTQFQNVMYKGTTPALQELMQGDLHFMFDLIAGNLAQIKAGTIRAIAVSAPRRSSSLPELPTMEEAGIAGFAPTNWFGIVGQAAVPRPIIERLSKEIVAIVNEPATRARLTQLGAEPVGSTPAEYDAFIRKEVTTWEAVAKNAGIKQE
jgi:tripartite-type tricarboxylate transporter receptor subunit TctC